MTCKTCKWLDVKPDKAGRIVARKNLSYLCIVEVPRPKLPDSITKSFGFRWPMPRSYMSIEQGESCPFYELREKQK